MSICNHNTPEQYQHPCIVQCSIASTFQIFLRKCRNVNSLVLLHALAYTAALIFCNHMDQSDLALHCTATVSVCQSNSVLAHYSGCLSSTPLWKGFWRWEIISPFNGQDWFQLNSCNIHRQSKLLELRNTMHFVLSEPLLFNIEIIYRFFSL